MHCKKIDNNTKSYKIAQKYTKKDAATLGHNDFIEKIKNATCYRNKCKTQIIEISDGVKKNLIINAHLDRDINRRTMIPYSIEYFKNVITESKTYLKKCLYHTCDYYKIIFMGDFNLAFNDEGHSVDSVLRDLCNSDVFCEKKCNENDGIIIFQNNRYTHNPYHKISSHIQMGGAYSKYLKYAKKNKN
jgi:hypothetical protein